MQGTLPYMAVSLMKPRDPIVHRLDHDLESVCYVLLHLVRFSTGPVGARYGSARKSCRVALWQHEESIKSIKDSKVTNLIKIISHPQRYLSEYWRPMAPFIAQILKLFPVKSASPTEAKINQKYLQFRNLLVAA